MKDKGKNWQNALFETFCIVNFTKAKVRKNFVAASKTSTRKYLICLVIGVYRKNV